MKQSPQKIKVLEDNLQFLRFAAEQVVEAFDYGQTIIELETALDDLRECLHDISR